MGIHERSTPEVHRQDMYRIGWKRGLISQGFHSVVKVKIRRFASESTHLRGFGLTSGRILTPEGLSPKIDKSHQIKHMLQHVLLTLHASVSL